MPILKTERGYEISGKEYQLLDKLLPEKIKKQEPITELIREVEPQSLETFLDFPMPYITEDLSNSDGLTLAHLAAKYGNVEALKELANFGAKLDKHSTKYGKTPLHFAAQYNHPNVIEYLVNEQHIPVNAPAVEVDYYDSKKATPLFQSAVHGSIEAAEKLLSLGANVNYTTSDGNTALHYACNYGFGWKKDEIVGQMIETLIKYGADPSIKGELLWGGKKTAVEMIDNQARRTFIQNLIDKYYLPVEIKSENKDEQVTPISIFNRKEIPVSESLEIENQVANRKTL